MNGTANRTPHFHGKTGLFVMEAARRSVLRAFLRMLATPALTAAAIGAATWLVPPMAILAQAKSNQLGTVTLVNGSDVVLKTAAGAEVTVTIDPAATILQLPAGSKNLKEATAGTLADVAVGDRVLATGSAGASPATLMASRIIVMRSGDIAALNASQQADWRRRGVSGIVRGVEGPLLTIAAGQHAVKVQTTPTTTFRRYAADSVNFSQAKPGTLNEVHVGDQLSVRGDKSADGSEITADEVVSGSFANLSGAIASVDEKAQTLTLKDLVSKKTVTVQVTPQSDLRHLSPEAARGFASRNRSVAAPAASSAAKTSSAVAPQLEGDRARNTGMDLSRMLARLPVDKLGDLKAGDAVLIVASQSDGGSYTAITMLSGVEELLSAKSGGSEPLTLSPWSLGPADSESPQ